MAPLIAAWSQGVADSNDPVSLFRDLGGIGTWPNSVLVLNLASPEIVYKQF